MAVSQRKKQYNAAQRWMQWTTIAALSVMWLIGVGLTASTLMANNFSAASIFLILTVIISVLISKIV